MSESEEGFVDDFDGQPEQTQEGTAVCLQERQKFEVFVLQN